MTGRPDTEDFLAQEGAKVRAFIATNRSDTLLRLFDYLLEQTIAGQTPRETDIAAAVYPDGQDNAGQQRSRVRVSVHRLRKKIEAFYVGNTGCQLLIPPGEYALQIRMPSAGEADIAPPPVVAPRRNGWLGVALVCLGLIVLNGLAAWLYVHRGQAANPIAGSPLWSSLAADNHPSALVMGDQFAFMIQEPGTPEGILVQDFDIRAPDDLYAYTASHPALRDKVIDQDLYSVSASILEPVSRIASYLRALRIDPVTSEGLAPETMQSSHIIYIGQFDEMSNLLRTPLFEASGLRCGPHCFDLTDKATGKRFVSDSPFVLGDSIVPRRDFGYLAKFPGPSGRSVIIISGTGDAGVRQAARIVTDSKMIAELRQRVGGDLTAFEALYQVRTMFDQTYGSNLVMARPVNADHIWDKTQPDWSREPSTGLPGPTGP